MPEVKLYWWRTPFRGFSWPLAKRVRASKAGHAFSAIVWLPGIAVSLWVAW